MQFLAWLFKSPVGLFVQESSWGYPAVLSTHAVGMGIVVGSVLMYDFRVLGFANKISLAWFDRLYLLAWFGFALNAVSGALLFTGDPVKFAFSTPFQIKILLIFAGAWSIWLLGRSIHRDIAGERTGVASTKSKWIAALSIFFWIGAIVAGRLIAYL